MAVEYLPNQALQTDQFLYNLTLNDYKIFREVNVKNGVTKRFINRVAKFSL